jgi:hypothetical protein
MSDDRIAVEQVLPGMTLHALPDGWTPVEALVLIKCLDEDGDPTWVYRTTAKPNREELLGALVVHTDLLRKELLGEWESEADA